jgi:hypothetical protein
MDRHTKAIVGLAWARELGLADDAFQRDRSQRVTRVDGSMVMYLSLWQYRILIGPAEVLAAARRLGDDQLSSGPALLALSGHSPAGHGRLMGEAVLGFTDSYVQDGQLEQATVTDDPEAVNDLEKSCPPDDVAEVNLSAMAWSCATLDELDQIRSGAGFDEWQGILAQMGVLTPPARRREGHGLMAAGIATNEALDRGLVPQWRARTGNRGSRRIAQRLGYARAGRQVTVLLDS